MSGSRPAPGIIVINPNSSQAVTAGMGSGNDRLRIRKQTFEPIVAAQNDLCLGKVYLAVSNRKKLAVSDFVA